MGGEGRREAAGGEGDPRTGVQGEGNRGSGVGEAPGEVREEVLGRERRGGEELWGERRRQGEREAGRRGLAGGGMPGGRDFCLMRYKGAGAVLCP